MDERERHDPVAASIEQGWYALTLVAAVVLVACIACALTLTAWGRAPWSPMAPEPTTSTTYEGTPT